ncbi:MAG: hypothetical protein AAF351_13660 [Pseudomonadota bacterium]
MRFAEVFLRLGSALVAWMVIFTYVLLLAILYQLECGPDGDEMHRLLLGLAPMALIAAFVIRATKPLPEVHSMLVWIAAPVAFLALLGARSTWQVFQAVNLQAASICSTTTTTWQTIWAPAQFVTLLVLVVLLFLTWRRRVSN